MVYRRFIFWLVLAVLSSGGCARKEPTPPVNTKGLRKVVLQTDWFPQAEHGGFYQALAKGFYAEAGLEVAILSGGPGVTIKLNVVKGVADFGLYRSDDVIVNASRGLPLTIVGTVLQHDPEALLVHADSPVKRLADLNGRSVTVAPGMSWIPYVQKKHGITFDLKPLTYGLAVFLADKEAIQQCIVTSEPYFVAQHGVSARTIPLADAEFDSYHTIMCRRELVRTSPEVIRAFLAASIRGWHDYLDGDPRPGNDLILKRNPQMTAGQIGYSRDALIVRALVKGDPAKGEGIGQLAIERIARQIALLTDLKMLETPVTLESVATREFLPPVTEP